MGGQPEAIGLTSRMEAHEQQQKEPGRSQQALMQTVRHVYRSLRTQGLERNRVYAEMRNAMQYLIEQRLITRLPSQEEAYKGTLLGEQDLLGQSNPNQHNQDRAHSQPSGPTNHPNDQQPSTLMTSTTYTREDSPAQKNVSFNRPDFPSIDPDEVSRKGVATELRPHQLQFVEFVRDRQRRGVRSIALFDEMGLGKTLSAIAACQVLHRDPSADVGGTLIVAPKSLITQWKAEIETHLRQGSHPDCVHLWYGPQREKDPELLKQYDYVATTYEVVRSAIQGNSRGRQKKKENGADGNVAAAEEDDDEEEQRTTSDCPLTKLTWHRIILDECHNVRNRTTQSMKALCKLSSDYKMALSGTPIQNSLSDLFSLLRWFKWEDYQLAQPDSRAGEKIAREAWHNNIAKPIQGKATRQEQDLAFNRLNNLLNEFVMRRTKSDRVEGESVMGVPPIQYEDVKDELRTVEKELYDRLLEQAREVFDQHVGSASAFRSAYMIILVRILRLRQACCHPLLVGIDHVTCDACSGGMSDELMQNATCGHALCSSCRSEELAKANVQAASQARKDASNAEENTDMKEQKEQASSAMGVEATCPAPTCDATLRESSLAALSDTSEELSELKQKTEKQCAAFGGSTKLHMLKQRLFPIVKKGEKALVFSQWPSFLDQCEESLSDDGILCARLDGKMTTEQRDRGVRAFKETHDTNVFLLSLKAGGVGLNLVEASHVFLTDVWWNPQTEQQAFERCHRLGQKKQVHVYRLLIRDSVEEQICQLQEKKRRVANATLEGDVSKLKDLDQEDIDLLLSASQGGTNQSAKPPIGSSSSIKSGGGGGGRGGGRQECRSSGNAGTRMNASVSAGKSGSSTKARASRVKTEHPDFANDGENDDEEEEEEDEPAAEAPPDLFQRFESNKRQKTENGLQSSDAPFWNTARISATQNAKSEDDDTNEGEGDDKEGGVGEELGPEDDDNELLALLDLQSSKGSKQEQQPQSQAKEERITDADLDNFLREDSGV
jgi:DNA repair protein RAD16